MPLDSLDGVNRTIQQTGTVREEELFNVVPALAQPLTVAAKAELVAAVTALRGYFTGPYQNEPNGRYNPTIGDYGIPGLKPSLAAIPGVNFLPAPNPHPTFVHGSAPMPYLDLTGVDILYLEKLQRGFDNLVAAINAAP